MNSMMNITVRVMAANARKEIEALRAEVAMLRAQMGMGAVASTGMITSQAFANISKWGSQMQWAGRQLVANFTLPLAAAGYMVTKLVLDNEAAMVRIQKVYGDAATGPARFAEDVNGLGKAFDLLSVKYATSRADVANIAADWAAAGAMGGGLARGVETTLKTMVLGELEAAEATQALIAIQAQYGADTKTLVGIIEVLNATENTTGATMGGLVQGMSRSASAARSAGVDVEHLAAMIAALSPAAGSASEAGTSLKTILSRMLGPTGEARDLMKAVGIEIDEVSWSSLNGAERLETLADAYMHLDGASQDMISAQAGVMSSTIASRRQINKFDVLMRELAYHVDGNSETNGYYTKTLELLARKADVARLASDELNSVLSSSPYAVKRAGIVIQNSLMEVLAQLMPQILWIVGSFATLIKKFSQLDPGLQKLIIGFLALLAVLGPPLVLLGSLAVAIGRIGLLMGSIGGLVTKFFGVFGLVGGAVSAVAGSVSGAAGRVRKTIAKVVATMGTAQATMAEQSAVGGAVAGNAWATAYNVSMVRGMNRTVMTRMSFNTFSAGAAGAGAAASGGFIARFVAGFKGLGPKLIGVIKGIGPAIMKGLAGIGPAIMRGLAVIIPMLSAWGTAIIGFLTGPWGIAIIAVVAILVIFRKQIGEFFSNIARQVGDATTPIGKAWQGITDLWNRALVAIRNGMQRLPEGVRAPLMAVLHMVKVVALKIYEFFSYINPFARHSPSLVENVTNGLAIVGQQFGLVATVIEGHMRSAYNSLSSFGGAVAGFLAEYKAFTQSQERSTIGGSAGPGAASAYDALIAQLGPLQADLDQVSAAVDAQQAIVDGLSNSLENAKNSAKIVQDQFNLLSDSTNVLSNSLSEAEQVLSDFASTPIEGMRAMSDAIFDNQMAEKALQLQMLQLNNVSLSDLQGQLASLNGEIEALRGTQADLRAGGASGDILQTYQDQIDVLQGQGDVIKGQVAPLNDLQTQLDALQRTGEILDLEQSLAFDPLTRQIDQLANSYSELPFGDIITGLQTQRVAVDQLQAAYDLSNAALGDQQVLLDAANASVNAAQLAYDTQSKTLDALKQVYSGLNDEITGIRDAIEEVISAAKDMEASLASARGGAGSQSPALDNFYGAAGGAFPDVGDAFTISDDQGDIQTWLDEFMDTTSTMFNDMDIFGPIKARWGQFQQWWATNVSPIFGNLWQGIVDAAGAVDWWAPFRSIGDLFGSDTTIGSAASGWWAQITEPFSGLWDEIKASFSKAWANLEPEFAKFGDAFGGVFQGFRDAWAKIQPAFPVIMQVIGAVVASIVGFVGVLAIIISNIVANVIVPLINTVVSIVTAIIRVFAGLVEFFRGIFSGDLAMAWAGIVDIFMGAWDLIYAVFRGAWDLIWGVVVGIKDGVVGAFQWLSDVLVGHSIIPDMITAIIEWFKSLPGKVLEFITNLVTAAISWFVDLKNKAIEKVVELVGSVIAWFINLKDQAIEKISALVSSVVSWFTGLPGKAASALGNTVTFLVTKGGDLITGLWDGIKNIWESTKTWFTNLPGNILTALGNLNTILKNAGKNIIQGFWDGMKEVWENTKKFVSGIGTWISDHKGPKQYDLKLLVPAGGWIMDGLEKGLSSGLPGILKTVTGISESILRTAGDANRFAIASMSTDAALAARSVVAGTGSNATLNGGASGSASTQNNNFYGDMSFPNITDPNDAKKFLENLGDLAGSGGSR